MGNALDLGLVVWEPSGGRIVVSYYGRHSRVEQPEPYVPHVDDLGAFYRRLCDRDRHGASLALIERWLGSEQMRRIGEPLASPLELLEWLQRPEVNGAFRPQDFVLSEAEVARAESGLDTVAAENQWLWAAHLPFDRRGVDDPVVEIREPKPSGERGGLLFEVRLSELLYRVLIDLDVFAVRLRCVEPLDLDQVDVLPARPKPGVMAWGGHVCGAAWLLRGSQGRGGVSCDRYVEPLHGLPIEWRLMRYHGRRRPDHPLLER